MHKNIKKRVYWLSTVLLLCSVNSSVHAEWHGSVKLVSDYIYRGYSKSRGNPVVQAHLEYENPDGWFTGVDVSQVRFDDYLNQDRAEMEAQPFLGWNQNINNDWRAVATAKAYIFDNKLFNQRADYAELYASAHYQDWLSLQFSFAPNAYQRNVDTFNYELNLRRDVLDNLLFSTGLGYYQAYSLLGHDSLYWNAGFSWFATDNLALDVRYIDSSLSTHYHSETTHDEFYPRPQDHQYLFSVSLGF